jgi:Zn-dependent protease with chaperone function
MINKLVFLFSVIAAKSSWAVSDTDLFKDVEKKGNVLIDFLTSGWFAFAITSAALIYVITAILQGNMVESFFASHPDALKRAQRIKSMLNNSL